MRQRLQRAVRGLRADGRLVEENAPQLHRTRLGGGVPADVIRAVDLTACVMIGGGEGGDDQGQVDGSKPRLSSEPGDAPGEQAGEHADKAEEQRQAEEMIEDDARRRREGDGDERGGPDAGRRAVDRRGDGGQRLSLKYRVHSTQYRALSSRAPFSVLIQV